MRKSLTIAAAVLTVAFFVSCAGLQNDTTDLEALADAVGFALGAYCHDNPDAAATVESIYYLAQSGIATPMEALNTGADYLIGTNDIATRLIVHEAFALIRSAGGTIIDTNIVELGEADKKLFEIGKKAYLEALEGINA